MKKKKKLEFQRLIEKYRGDGVAPECPYFGRCGGCMFQDMRYEDQLLLKKEYVNSLVASFAEIPEIQPSIPYRYRNRMDMVTAFGRVGLREAGSYRTVVDIEQCPIMQEKTNDVYRRLQALLRDVPGYDYLAHRGYLRYAVLRQGMFTGQVMVNFVTAEREQGLMAVIEAVVSDIDSLSLLFNDGLADTSFGEPFETVKQGYIEEQFDHVTFRITPNSFFQSNSHIARSMYRKIRDVVKGRTLDLYSGVGSISLFVADRASDVTGIEAVPEAVACAEVNRELNAISNVHFICADARAYLREHTESYDTVIMDPPRGGMHPKMVRYLNESGPSTVIYMSCNPTAFAQDASRMDHYSLRWIEAYDMFPQTPHLETLALFTRK